jgi:ABC-type multidrug transport system ATPase subunit
VNPSRFCPQQDILWNELTVEEHLMFYCALKNHGGDVAYLHVVCNFNLQQCFELVPINFLQQRLAAEVGLSGEHLHKRVDQLSGGLKRKLSVGISLVCCFFSLLFFLFFFFCFFCFFFYTPKLFYHQQLTGWIIKTCFIG